MDDDIAVSLDRELVAELSYIAGVGGDVGPFVDTATSGRPVLVIDCCSLECAKARLAAAASALDAQVLGRGKLEVRLSPVITAQRLSRRYCGS